MTEKYPKRFGLGNGRRHLVQQVSGVTVGLRGIEERVKELGGSVSLTRATSKGGTLLAVHLPLPAVAEEQTLARLAG